MSRFAVGADMNGDYFATAQVAPNMLVQLYMDGELETFEAVFSRLVDSLQQRLAEELPKTFSFTRAVVIRIGRGKVTNRQSLVLTFRPNQEPHPDGTTRLETQELLEHLAETTLQQSTQPQESE
jgi:hypothetical protein